MDRLQLYISKSLQQFKTLVNINGNEMTRRQLRDLRQALESVSYDCREKCVFYLIQYIEGATVVSVLRTIPDKPLDHLNASVVIPDGLKIAAAQLYDIIRTITRKVSNPGMSNDDISQLRQLFQTEYPVDDVAAVRVPSEGSKFAARYFGGGEMPKLIDFFGDNLYQPLDVAYAGVVLVDAELPFKIIGTDISYQPLAKAVTLLPPDKVSGFTPHLFNREFSKPFLVALNSTVDIRWTRPGFEDILQQVTIESDGIQPDVPAVQEVCKTVSRSVFYITSHNSDKRMEDCVIKVNGVEITGSRSFPQSELEQAEVQVAAPGYLTYMGMIDLATNEQALIELMPDRGHDGVADADAGRRQGPQTIPSHSGRKSMRWWQKALFVFLGIGLALGGCYLFMPELFDVAGSKKFASASTETVPPNSIAAGKMRVDNVTTTVGDTAKERNIAESQAVAQPNTQNKQENAQSKQESAQAARQESAGNAAQGAKPAENQSQTQKPAEAKPADENAVAVKYLDGNAYWKESEVASNSLLKSYYNDLLNFNLNALANEWPKKLPASKWVATVARHAREALGKKLDPKAKGNTYTLSGKGKIHRQEYINWINRRKE